MQGSTQAPTGGFLSFAACPPAVVLGILTFSTLCLRFYPLRTVSVRQCLREDLNLHGVSPTSPSSWRAYQFRHEDILKMKNKPHPRCCSTNLLEISLIRIQISRATELVTVAERALFREGSWPLWLIFIVFPPGLEPGTFWM